jgi:hypothetical protein
MIVHDYILLIMNCKRYEFKAEQQKNTWLQTIPSYLKYYHVKGNMDMDTEFRFDDVERVLWVKTLDDYNSLPKKVIAAYNAVKETYTFRYLFKTDDDQNLVNIRFFDTIINIIEAKRPVTHYGGNVVNVVVPHISQYYTIHDELPRNLIIKPTKYCNGRFYFLSNNAVLNLLNKQELIRGEFFEDYAIGFYLDEEFKKNIFQINTDKFFIDNTFH